MTDEQRSEAMRLLRIAAKAANKLDLNRHLYRYEWMKKISAEVIWLEQERDALFALISEIED